MTALVNLIILIVVVIGVVYVLRTLRPKLREQRLRRWEKAGLLPHQVDPHTPRKADGNVDHPVDHTADHDTDDGNNRR